MEVSTSHNSIPAVAITTRACTGQQAITVPAGTGAPLVSLLSSSIPQDAVTCEIQADGGIIRIGLAGAMVTSDTGFRLDDGATRLIDSDLAMVTLVADGATSVPVAVAFFDRV